jgi:arsenate reductase (thioredoxin)
MKVIIACIHNAGRSQMAAAFFNEFADTSKAHAMSAGTEPADRIHEGVLLSMKEVGIDLSGLKPQRLTDELASDADLLITMGCGEACPYISGLKREDWPLPDPKGKTKEELRSIRDDIRVKVTQLLHDLNAMSSTAESGQIQKV